MLLQVSSGTVPEPTKELTEALRNNQTLKELTLVLAFIICYLQFFYSRKRISLTNLEWFSLIIFLSN